MSHISRRRVVRSIKDALGWTEWEADILWLAHRQDAEALAHELGNSAGVLLRVYREIVTREEVPNPKSSPTAAGSGHWLQNRRPRNWCART